jgi:hypothetical protein
LLAGGAGGIYRRYDATAAGCDFGVTRALEAQFELVGPIAGINQVGMAVDQSGSQQPVAAIDDLVRIPRRSLVAVSYPGDAVAVHQQRGLPLQPVSGFVSHRSESCVGKQSSRH